MPVQTMLIQARPAPTLIAMSKVPGQMPVNQPLQLSPAGVSPEYGKSTNYHPGQNNFQSNNTQSNNPATTQPTAAVPAKTQAITAQAPGLTAQSNSGAQTGGSIYPALILWLMVILFGALAYVLYKKQ